MVCKCCGKGQFLKNKKCFCYSFLVFRAANVSQLKSFCVLFGNSHCFAAVDFRVIKLPDVLNIAPYS